MVQGGYVAPSSTKTLTVKKKNILDKGSSRTTKSNSNSNNRHKDNDSPPPSSDVSQVYQRKKLHYYINLRYFFF